MPASDQSQHKQVQGGSESSTIFSKLSFVCISPRIYIALYNQTQAETMAQHALNLKHVLVSIETVIRDDFGICQDVKEHGYRPCSLIDIYKFDEIVNQVARRDADHKLVIVAGCRAILQSKAFFLIGCHMILSQGLDAEQTYTIFKDRGQLSLLEGSPDNIVAVVDCWRALHRAASVSWIDFREHLNVECDDDLTINMDEFIHYSRWNTKQSMQN
jgi:hypothetical protein